MAERDSNGTDRPSSPELIVAETQELMETIRTNQRELDARIAETTELIDRTHQLLEDSETVERSLDGHPEKS